MSGGRATHFVERGAPGLAGSPLLHARAWAAGMGVRGGRTLALGWPGPGEGPRRGARRAIVWAGAQGAVVVCTRAELCAAPAPWSPAAAGIGRSSSVALCAGDRVGKRRRVNGDFGSSLTSAAFNMHFPASVSHLRCPPHLHPGFLSLLPGTVPGLGIERCSGTGHGNHSSSEQIFYFCRHVEDALTLQGAGKRGRGASSYDRWSVHLRARAS